MKKFDIIKLTDATNYKNHNLKEGTFGIVLNIENKKIETMFFNPQNKGDYMVLKIKSSEVDLVEHLDENFLKKYNIDFEKLTKNAKNFFLPQEIKLFDRVKLVCDKEKCKKYGIDRGEIGIVIDDHAIMNNVEVDFVNHESTIGVNINDLEKIS